jgi:hypothetical protein
MGRRASRKPGGQETSSQERITNLRNGRLRKGVPGVHDIPIPIFLLEVRGDSGFFLPWWQG